MRNLRLLGLLGAALASMPDVWTLNIQPGSASLRPAPRPTPRRYHKSRVSKAGAQPHATLKGYYSRYSHVMAEMKLHLNFKHPFSETKRRPK